MDSADSYQALGNFIVDLCPPNFAEALFEAEVDDGWADMRLSSSDTNGVLSEVELAGLSMYRMHLALDNLWKDMANQSGSRWSRCTFRVLSDRAFKLDVQYD